MLFSDSRVLAVQFANLVERMVIRVTNDIDNGLGFNRLFVIRELLSRKCSELQIDDVGAAISSVQVLFYA